MQGSPTTPLLTSLLDVQDRNNEVVAHPHIEAHAQHVVDWAMQFDQPVLVPVGVAAQRLLGAVAPLAKGTLEIPLYGDRFDGRTALLVGAIAGSLIEFEAAAANVRRRGANSVHACAIDVTHQVPTAALDSFTVLNAATSTVRQSA